MRNVSTCESNQLEQSEPLDVDVVHGESVIDLRASVAKLSGTTACRSTFAFYLDLRGGRPKIRRALPKISKPEATHVVVNVPAAPLLAGSWFTWIPSIFGSTVVGMFTARTTAGITTGATVITGGLVVVGAAKGGEQPQATPQLPPEQ